VGRTWVTRASRR